LLRQGILDYVIGDGRLPEHLCHALQDFQSMWRHLINAPGNIAHNTKRAGGFLGVFK
jgi:hypothetical protein